MLLAGLALIAKYGTKTFPQNDEVWALYDAGQGIDLGWLWKPWAEHRIPLAKLLWKGVLERTDYDFRVGNFLSFLLLGGTSFGWIWAVRKLRGRTILADAFFPLAVMNFGQAQVFLWWWQVNHILAPVIASLILILIALRGDNLRTRDSIWISAGLVVLSLSGPGGLPYTVALAVWLIGQHRARTFLVLSLVTVALAVSALYFVNYDPFFPVSDPPTLPTWPVSPGLHAEARAILQILAFSVGTATRPYAVFWGIGVLALALVSVATLIRAAISDGSDRSDGRERTRTMGLLMFLGAAGALVFLIGKSRAGMGSGYFFQGHYLTLQAPALCAVYLVWEVCGRTLGRGIQVAMLLVGCALLPWNLKHGLQVGEALQQQTMAFERDVRNHVPPSVLAERHFASDVVPRAQKLASILKNHKQRGIGIFKEMRDDPFSRIADLPVEPAILEQVDWRNGVASTGGENSSLTFLLGTTRQVYAVRLHYAYIKTTSPWPTLRVFWADSGQEFSEERKWASTTPGPDQPTWALVDGRIQTDALVRTERTLTVWIDTAIDRIRIYPDNAPCEIRLSKIELLVPP